MSEFTYAYSLLVRRYGYYVTFDSLEELKEEVRKYFTKSEAHLVDRLTQFPENRYDQYGTQVRSCRDFETTAMRYKEGE